MKHAPNTWDLASLSKYLKDGPLIRCEQGDFPARPEGLFSVLSRLTLAWEVFTGRADVLRWPGGQ